MTTLQEQIRSDLAAIFSTSDFGRPARYAPEAGPVVDLVVLVNAETEMEGSAFGSNPADEAEIKVQTADVPAPAHGDLVTLTDTDETYRVIVVKRKGYGLAVLSCTRRERMG